MNFANHCFRNVQNKFATILRQVSNFFIKNNLDGIYGCNKK